MTPLAGRSRPYVYITVPLSAARINKITPRKAVEQRVHHVTNLLDVADAEARLFELRLQIKPGLSARRSLYQRVQEPDACGLQVQTATCAAHHANQKAESHRLAETQPQSGEGLRHRAVATPGRLASLRQQLHTNTRSHHSVHKYRCEQHIKARRHLRQRFAKCLRRANCGPLPGVHQPHFLKDEVSIQNSKKNCKCVLHFPPHIFA